MPKGKDIVKTLRERLGDETEPFLWSPSFLLAAANEAEREAVRRILAITDDTTAVLAGTAGTSFVCRVTLGIGTAGYVLSDKVLQVVRAKLPSDAAAVAAGTAGYAAPLDQYTRDQLDKEMPDWENLEGTPWGFVTEVGNEIRFVPKPVVATTAALTVKRLPLADFTLETEPEFYSEHWLHWAMVLAYQRPDSETLNLPLAQYHEQKMTEYFGPPVSFRDLQQRRQMARGGSFRFRRFGS